MKYITCSRSIFTAIILLFSMVLVGFMGVYQTHAHGGNGTGGGPGGDGSGNGYGGGNDGGVSGSSESSGSDNDSGGGYSGSGADADANGASGNNNNGGDSRSDRGVNTDSGNSTGGSTSGKSTGFFGGLFSGNPGKPTGFFGGILGGIKDFFGGVFSGSNASTDTSSRGFPETGGGDRDDSSSIPANIDLVPETQKVTVLADKTIFAGQIKLIETTDSDILRSLRYLGNSSVTITNMLLVDYGCDGTIESEQKFLIPFTTLQSGTIRVIPLSTKFATGGAGDHCFAFEIDTENTVAEIDETNNKTKWHTFTIESDKIPSNPAVTECPLYQQPICATDEKVISGETDINGCQKEPQCISNRPASPDDISFEVKSYVLSDATGSGVRTRVTTQNWSSDNLTLTGDEKLAFRWNAPKYENCLAFIYPETYVFNSNTTAVTGNTEELAITIKSLNREYSIECTTGDVIHKQTIDVTIN